MRAKQAFTGRQGGATVYSRLDLEEEDNGLGASLLTSPGAAGGRAPDPGLGAGAGTGAGAGAGAGAFSSGAGGHVFVGAEDYAGGGHWQGHAGYGGEGEVDVGSMVPTPEEELLQTSQLAKEAAELLWEFLALGTAGVQDADIHAHLSTLLANARVLQAQMRGHISNYQGGNEAGLAMALEASDMLTTCLQEYEGSHGAAPQVRAPPSSGYQAPQPLAEPLPAPAATAAAAAASPFPAVAAPPSFPPVPGPAATVAPPPRADLLGLEGTGLEELVAPSPPPAASGGAVAPAPTLQPGDSLL